MSIFHLATASLCALLALSPTNRAEAQQRPSCPVADGSALIAETQKERGEDPSALAFTASGRLLYVLVNRTTGTFSIIIIAPDGRGCLVSTGTDWDWLPSEGERP